MKTKKKLSKALTLILVLVVVASFFSLTASAYWSKSGKNPVAVIETSKAPFYLFWQAPQVTVKNTGNTAMTVIIYNSNGSIYKQLTNLAAGKSKTFDLKGNSEYTVTCTGNAYTYGFVTGEIVAGRYLKSFR